MFNVAAVADESHHVVYVAYSFSSNLDTTFMVVEINMHTMETKMMPSLINEHPYEYRKSPLSLAITEPD